MLFVFDVIDVLCCVVFVMLVSCSFFFLERSGDGKQSMQIFFL